MEPFAFTRRTAVFLGVLAVLAVLIVLFVAGHEGQRNTSGQRTQPAGSVAQPPEETPPTPVLPDTRSIVTRSTHYADPGMQRALKDELERAGIPFSAEVKQGREFISWRPEDNAQVEKIQGALVAPPSPGERSVHFDNPARQQAFKEWLVKRGVEYQVTNLHGREFVVWKDGPPELALMFVKEQYEPCPKPAAKAKAPAKQAKPAPAGC